MNPNSKVKLFARVAGIVLFALGGCPDPARGQSASWAQITHPSSPAFAHHDMTYDSARHRLIVAGRTSIMQGAFAVYAGAADGSWTQLASPDPPLPGREDIELAYDSHRDRVVLYTTATNKVWEFDGAAWSVITAATAPIQAKDGAQMQYDPLRQKTVLVGAEGWPGLAKASETWLWDGENWSLAAGADQSPPGAAGGAMAFDAARGEIVLLTFLTMQTWTFDGAAWTRLAPDTIPNPGVWVFDLAYHPPTERVVFFGGEHLDSSLEFSAVWPTNTWAWDGTNWSKLNPPSTPPPTIDYALAWFPERGGLVLHGGWGDPDWDFRPDVWLLTLESGSQPEIRFIGIQREAANLRLTSTGLKTAGFRQILQISVNLLHAEEWSNSQTNAAPAATNTWLVPQAGAEGYLRIMEAP